MGQYFRPIIGDKNGQNCKRFKYNNVKLMEHAWWNNDFTNKISAQIYNKQGRICWTGDYADEPNDFKFAINTALHTPNYEEVWHSNITLLPLPFANFTLDNKYLINYDTMQYLNLNEYKSASKSNQGIVHPLPLLTAVGNDRGFGDFHEGNIGYEFVGIWAWNLISITDHQPKDFKKINIVFIEI